MWLAPSQPCLSLCLCCFPTLLILCATAENHLLLFFSLVQPVPKCCGEASAGREAGGASSQALLTAGMRGQLWAGQREGSSSPEVMSSCICKSVESHRVKLSFED